MREPSIPVSTTATWTPSPLSPARRSAGTPSPRATSALAPSLFERFVAADQDDATRHRRLSSFFWIDQCYDERVQDEEERPVQLLTGNVLERPTQGEHPHGERTGRDDRLRCGRPSPGRRGLLPRPPGREAEP